MDIFVVEHWKTFIIRTKKIKDASWFNYMSVEIQVDCRYRWNDVPVDEKEKNSIELQTRE